MAETFRPDKAATVNINVSSSSQSVQVTDSLGPVQVRIMNNGTATVWINFGNSTVTAAVGSGVPIGPGVTEVLTGDTTGPGPLFVAAIAAGATGNIYFTSGRGY